MASWFKVQPFMEHSGVDSSPPTSKSISKSALDTLEAKGLKDPTAGLKDTKKLSKKMAINIGTSEENENGSEKEFLLELGHPMLNRVVDSFVKVSGVGALQAVSQDAYHLLLQGSEAAVRCIKSKQAPGAVSLRPKPNLPRLHGETGRKSLEKMVEHVGRESLQWGLAAGVYTGATYGLQEVRGKHDWRNAAVAGALTGATLALTQENPSHELVVQSAIAGGAMATAAEFLQKYLK